MQEIEPRLRMLAAEGPHVRTASYLVPITAKTREEELLLSDFVSTKPTTTAPHECSGV